MQKWPDELFLFDCKTIFYNGNYGNENIFRKSISGKKRPINDTENSFRFPEKEIGMNRFEKNN